MQSTSFVKCSLRNGVGQSIKNKINIIIAILISSVQVNMTILITSKRLFERGRKTFLIIKALFAIALAFVAVRNFACY